MSLTVLTTATSRRLTTAQALYQDTGNVVYLEEPTLANAMIDQASSAIEAWCGRIFAQQRYQETGPEVCGASVILRQRPIVAVESLLAGEALVTDSRVEQAEAGLLFRRGGWGAYGHYDAWYGWYELVLEYVAGWIVPEQASHVTPPPVPSGPLLPADVERACLECVKVWFSERSPDTRVTSRRIGDQAISYSIQSGKTALPALSQAILEPYRQWVVR